MKKSNSEVQQVNKTSELPRSIVVDLGDSGSYWLRVVLDETCSRCENVGVYSGEVSGHENDRVCRDCLVKASKAFSGIKLIQRY